MSLSTRKNRLVLLGIVLVLIAGGVTAYLLWPRLPAPGSPRYQDYLREFEVGVAACESPKLVHEAMAKLDSAIALIPEEPAAWANRGLLRLRTNDFANAARDLKHAQELAPESGEIEELLGLLARQQNRLPESAAHLRKAINKDGRNLSLIYLLASVLQQEDEAKHAAEIQQLMEHILAFSPNNLRALAIRAEQANLRGDQAALKESLAQLDQLAPGWPELPRQQLATAHKSVANAPENASLELRRLHNVLQSVRGYRRDTGDIREDVQPGTVIHHFLRLRPPPPAPAPPDHNLTFGIGPWAAAQPVVGLDKERWDGLWLQWRMRAQEYASVVKSAIDGGPAGAQGRAFVPAVWVANGRVVRRADAQAPDLPFPGGAKNVAPSPAGVLALDWNNDLRTDLLLAGAGGLRFWQLQADDTLIDVTAKTGLPANVLDGDYYGAWAADFDMDGDLDIILARRSGAPLVLRNNGDGTFKTIDVPEFAALRDVRAFVWADIDNDGASDAVFLDAAGTLHVFGNQRHGQFAVWPQSLPTTVGAVQAVTAADVNDDGVFDLIALRKQDGTLVRISDVNHRQSWQVADLAQATVAKDAPAGTTLLFAEDLDNNGALDLIVAGPDSAQVFLADARFKFAALPGTIAMRVGAVLDFGEDGRLDLLGLDGGGRLTRAENAGKKQYHWQELQPVANPKAVGDNRNNAFAIGGELEVRAGLLVQKQRITGARLHFGLGEQDGINVARIIWPSGEPQWEFELPPPVKWLALLAAQRLNGSCPFLFTYDGAGMHFAGDCLWNTPLGMFVNGQEVDSFGQTTEWLKIPGEHLVPKDGTYDVRVHANLWETDYFDQLALLVVDHPPGTEMHVDERFFLTPTPPKLYVTTPARPVAHAWDHLGRDATEEVNAIDGRYLDRAGRGKYQGITADHWVEADLGDDAPTEGPVYLIARGWTHPTDSSINVAITQGSHAAPRPVTLEVPDGKGGWKVGRPALGFPAGKNKTMVIRLDGIDGAGVSRRFRLRTNMEIYWDFLGYARGLDEQLARIGRPEAQSAQLRYRGLLQMTQKDASSPELPHYDRVLTGRQLWRDLTGHYTRFGDVRELLAKVDDRYVIMNAGDEIALRFPVPPGPSPGWQRDFIFECDGWTRDGNANTRFGTTVLPLPMHGIKGLDQPPGRLEDDPVYRRFPADWLTYHTRYVSTDHFERGLRTMRR
jgi:cytochrome c-type biogenesis protein CcmH/NrfG